MHKGKNKGWGNPKRRKGGQGGRERKRERKNAKPNLISIVIGIASIKNNGKQRQ